MVFENPSLEDRRTFDRFMARFPARFKDSRQDYGSNVSLRNASADGAKITTREQLYRDDTVILEVELPDCKDPMILKGHVVWVKSEEPGMWDVGLKFYKIDLPYMSRLYKFVDPSFCAL